MTKFVCEYCGSIYEDKVRKLTKEHLKLIEKLGKIEKEGFKDITHFHRCPICKKNRFLAL